MFRWLTIQILYLWGIVMFIIGLSLIVVPYLPYNGTLVLTQNIFLDDHERFVLIDIDRKVMISFSPSLGDEERVFAMVLSPEQQRLIKIGYLADNSYGLRITDLQGNDDHPAISMPNTNILSDSIVFSWDGSKAIIPTGLSNNRIEQFLLDLGSGELTRFDMLYATQESSVAWSPNDQRIAYLNANGYLETQIIIGDIRGDNISRVTEGNYSAYCPSWSPDGRIISYVESYDGFDYLRFTSLDNSDVSDLIEGRWHMTTCPQWTTNGNNLSFISLDLNTLETEIVLYNPHTGREQSLLSVDRTASLTVWR